MFWLTHPYLDFHANGLIGECMKKLSAGLYLVAQNGGRHRDTPEDFAHTSKYLQITEAKVLLGEEAKTYATEHSWDNSETLWINFGDEFNKPTILVF